MDDLSTKAVLINARVRGWQARAVNKTAAQNAEQCAGATSGTGSFSQKLFPQGFPALKRADAILTVARKVIQSLSVSWDDTGKGRLVPVKNISALSLRLGQCKDDLALAIPPCRDAWPSAMEGARPLLARLFREKDYDPKALDRFSIAWAYAPVPTADWRVEVSDDVAADMRQSFALAEKAKAEVMVSDLATRLLRPLQEAAKTLASPSKVFRDSLICNLREAVAEIRDLNLTENSELDDLACRVESSLANINPEQLRVDAPLRSQSATTAYYLAADANDLVEMLAPKEDVA